MGEGTRAAAIFDLDRTLLGDSSGLLVTEALVDVGLLSERDRRIADVTRRAYRAVGETWIGMQATRRSVSRIAGWSVEDLREAARRSVDRLDGAVYAEARALIERHRAAGRIVCIATSTGRHFVEPLCEHLGVDRLIATEYEDHEGRLTGRFLGEWLWGPAKAEAVRAFAREDDVDLGASYVYTDSYYDRQLLEMAGYPRPVNPDPLLRGLAVHRGWPILEFRNRPEGPRPGIEPYDLFRPFTHPLLAPMAIKAEGLEGIPAEGPCIIAANHRSYLDPVVLSAVALRRGRKLRYLGKREVFDVPVFGQFARMLGQIRVDRGSGQARPLQEAVDALDRGEAIGIFPQATIPRGREFFAHRLEGKTGVARLAAATGVPVIPIALWDTEKIWPRKEKIPKPFELARRRPVHARVGPPMYLAAPPGGEEDPAAMHELTQQVLEGIQQLLPAEVAYPPPPTPEQIREMWPSNIPLPDEELRA